MLKYIATALTSALLIIGGATNAQADGYDNPVHTFKNGSVKLEKADRKVKHRKITYWEQVYKGHVFVELNSGASFDLVPCKTEDSRNCYWDAKKRVNKVGRSFVDIRGKAIYF